MTATQRFRDPRLWLGLGTLAIISVLLMPRLIGALAAGGLHAAARERQLDARWRQLDLSWPGRLRLDEFVLTRHASGDTLVRAQTLELRIAPGSWLSGHPRPEWLTLASGDIYLPRPARTADDSLPAGLVLDEARDPRAADPSRLQHLRQRLSGWIRALAKPAHDVPSFTLTDIVMHAPSARAAGGDAVRIGWLEHRATADGERITLAGSVLGTPDMPFESNLAASRDGHLSGSARIGFTEPDGQHADLRLSLDGHVATDPASGRITVDDATRLGIGAIPLRLGGVLDPAGPSIRMRLAADSLTQSMLEASLPRSVLGRLHDLGTVGSWDYRLEAALDLSEPDSVRFHADVIPHALRLDPDRTFLPVLALEEPFVAHIHLPHDRVVERLMSSANPHFRPLAAISPQLVTAVLKSEDGGFFRHRGFSGEAIRGAIADDLKAGTYKRGAGTITMQLARNLYLGHDRTMSRKFQEVVLAWVLEHLSGVSKERMLELYLNIVEWGPDTHGADEAAHFYFDCDAGALTLDQSLFLATLLPSPARWRSRFDREGVLRPWVRSQMRAVLRAMARDETSGLASDSVPSADSLHVELAGTALVLLASPPSTDSLATPPATDTESDPR